MTPLAVAGAWLTLAQGATLAEAPQRAYVASTATAAARITQHLRPAEAERVRAVTFTRRTVVAAFVRVPTPCNSTHITGFSRNGKTLVVHVEVREPAPGTMCTQVIATGYHVLSVPKLAAPTRVVLRLNG